MLRVITTLYNGTCAETNKPILKGEKALYDPRTGLLYRAGTVAMAKYLREGELPFIEPVSVAIEIQIDGCSYKLTVRDGEVIRISPNTAYQVESTHP